VGPYLTNLTANGSAREMVQQVPKRLFPRLHTLFDYNYLMNGPNLTIFGM